MFLCYAWWILESATIHFWSILPWHAAELKETDHLYVIPSESMVVWGWGVFPCSYFLKAPKEKRTDGQLRAVTGWHRRPRRRRHRRQRSRNTSLPTDAQSKLANHSRCQLTAWLPVGKAVPLYHTLFWNARSDWWRTSESSSSSTVHYTHSSARVQFC